MLSRIFLSLRVPEVLFMSSFFLAAALFMPCEAFSMTKLSLIYTCIILYIQSVYTLNSFADYSFDIQNSRLKNVFLISRTMYARLTIVLLAVSLIIALAINTVICTLLLLSFFHWLVYYLPPLRFKSRFALGTLLHFSGGLLHYYICHLALTDFTTGSLFTALYIALLLSAGHLNHEAIDYEADLKTNTRTTTVTFGLTLNRVIIRFILFLSAAGLIVGYFNKALLWAELVILLIPTSLVLSYAMFFDYSTLRFQMLYRSVFALSGLVLVIRKLYLCGFWTSIAL
jgi:4-hydroxybenzoate polyprenyltransferase